MCEHSIRKMYARHAAVEREYLLVSNLKMSSTTRNLWMSNFQMHMNERVRAVHSTQMPAFNMSSAQEFFLNRHTSTTTPFNLTPRPTHLNPAYNWQVPNYFNQPPNYFDQVSNSYNQAPNSYNWNHSDQQRVSKKSRTLSTSATQPSFPSHTTPLCQPSLTLTMPRRDTVTVPMSGAWYAPGTQKLDQSLM